MTLLHRFAIVVGVASLCALAGQASAFPTDAFHRAAPQVKLKLPKQKVALHMRDHKFIFTPGLGLRQRLKAYKIVVSHDDYLIHRPANIPPAVLAHHRHERAHALAHIKKINAKLHPPFTYPWWWVPLGICETGSNPPDPAFVGGGYYGWINFLQSTWEYYGGLRYAPSANLATEYEQYIITMVMHADVPWSQSNPACSARIGM